MVLYNSLLDHPHPLPHHCQRHILGLSTMSIPLWHSLTRSPLYNSLHPLSHYYWLALILLSLYFFPYVYPPLHSSLPISLYNSLHPLSYSSLSISSPMSIPPCTLLSLSLSLLLLSYHLSISNKLRLKRSRRDHIAVQYMAYRNIHVMMYGTKKNIALWYRMSIYVP